MSDEPKKESDLTFQELYKKMRQKQIYEAESHHDGRPRAGEEDHDPLLEALKREHPEKEPK
jgi:hypothetical protein